MFYVIIFLILKYYFGIMKKKHKHKIKKSVKRVIRDIDIFVVVLWVVMIWRGLWNFLDRYFLSDMFFLSNVLSITFWVVIIFLHDFSLKKLEE